MKLEKKKFQVWILILYCETCVFGIKFSRICLKIGKYKFDSSVYLIDVL